MIEMKSLSVVALSVPLAVLLFGCVTVRKPPLVAEIVSELPRPEKPDGLSGITRLPNGNYLAIDDTDGRLFELAVRLDGDGALDECEIVRSVKLDGVVDGEGIAYDPLVGTVWVADEKDNSIAEFDVSTGSRLRSVERQPWLDRCRRNLGLESLAIAPDGLSMWTANEETADGDGPRSSVKSGSRVRLMRFTRRSGEEAWRLDGMYAYVTEPVEGGAHRGETWSGVSDLVVLRDGRLVVLEREMSVKGVMPSFRLGLFDVDFADADDVRDVSSLDGGAAVPVAKRRLLVADTMFAMYEGVSAGQMLPDGVETLLLVSDGDGPADESLALVRISAAESEQSTYGEEK